jgi:hypothetical protein
MADSPLKTSDIQGIVATGYGPLESGAYVLLRVDNAPAACTWLSQIAPFVTNAGERPKERALNVAFADPGLQALGLDAGSLESFPAELREGMTNAYARACWATMVRARLSAGAGADPRTRQCTYSSWFSPAAKRKCAASLLSSTSVR